MHFRTKVFKSEGFPIHSLCHKNSEQVFVENTNFNAFSAREKNPQKMDVSLF